MTTSPLARWAVHDAEHAIHQADRDAIAATEPVRALVVDLAGAGTRDFFTACARLGRLLAASGASPSLAANTIDGAIRALVETGASIDPSAAAPARACVIEGYVAALHELERNAASAQWEYPACTVPLGDGTVAVACGHPLEDPDALATWAGRVASRLAKAKVRRIVLAGPEAARTEVATAAALVGIDVAPGSEQEARGRSWLRLPWRK